MRPADVPAHSPASGTGGGSDGKSAGGVAGERDPGARIGSRPVACTVLWSAPLPEERRWLELLDETERARHARFHAALDRRRFLTGRVLAKTAAGEVLGSPAAAVMLDATCGDCGKPHGKPRVVAGSRALELSITHSGDWVGLAYTAAEPVGTGPVATGPVEDGPAEDGPVAAAPIGLDVEAAAGSRDLRGAIGYALHPDERAELDARAEVDRPAAFLRYWARKEAIMKAAGRGLGLPLRALVVTAPWEPPALRSSTDPGVHPSGVRLADLGVRAGPAAGDGYASLAVLTEHPIEVTERAANLAER